MARMMPMLPIVVMACLCVAIAATADEPASTTPGANTACVNGCTLPLGHIISFKGNSYEVLSPWAEIDPPPLRPINPRLSSLDGMRAEGVSP